MKLQSLKSIRAAKFFAAILVLALLAGIVFEVSQPPQAKAQTSYTIGVSIVGPSSVGAQTPTTYTAKVLNASYGADLFYLWQINPTDNVVLEQHGVNCTVTFTNATETYYSLSVMVQDTFNHGYGSAATPIKDPYTQSNLYLGAYGAPYSYLIESDGKGWYQAIDGKTGQIAFTSTNFATTFQSVLSDPTEGFVYIGAGSFTFTSTLNFTVNGKIIVGSGRDTTLLYYTPNSGVAFNIARTPGNDTSLTIEKLALRGLYGGTGVLIQHAATVHIKNCVIDRFGIGVNIQGNSYVDVIDSTTIGCTGVTNGTAVQFDTLGGYIPHHIEMYLVDLGYTAEFGIVGSVDTLWFHNSYTEGTHNSAIYSVNMFNSIFNSNTFYGPDNGDHPTISLMYGGGNNTFENNYVSVSNNNGFDIGTLRNRITGNTIIANGAHGFGILMCAGANYTRLTENCIATSAAYFASIAQNGSDVFGYNIFALNDVSQSGTYLMGHLNATGTSVIANNIGNLVS